NTRRGAGEEDVALAARQHQPRSLATGQKARVAGHLPNLAKHALGGLDDREIDVGTDVEDADLQRCMLIGVRQEFDDLVFFSGIERAPEGGSSGLFDLSDQGRKLLAVAASGKHGKAFSGKLLCDCRSDEVA